MKIRWNKILKIFRKKNMQKETDPRFFVFCQKETKDYKSSHFLVTVPYGIGDAIYLGLAVVDQIVKNMPEAEGRIDFLCNTLQAELLSCDPRLNQVIIADRNLFPINNKKTLPRIIFVPNQAEELKQFLKERKYLAVFPGNAAFGLLKQLDTDIMLPNPVGIIKDAIVLKRFKNATANRRARIIINGYFGNKLSEPGIDEKIPLYIDPHYILEAQREVERIKKTSDLPKDETKLLIVAPDTTSAVTRPSRKLLEEGIVKALEQEEKLLVYVLPSYTDPWVSDGLYASLLMRFGKERVSLMPASPKQHLLAMTALIDQSDIFITGDTGLMHLAATEKIVNGDKNVKPKNTVRIIAIFGGTNPGLYGYPLRTKIIGRGGKEQRKFRPGFIKEAYKPPKDKDYFNHIHPKTLTEAIIESSNK